MQRRCGAACGRGAAGPTHGAGHAPRQRCRAQCPCTTWRCCGTTAGVGTRAVHVCTAARAPQVPCPVPASWSTTRPPRGRCPARQARAVRAKLGCGLASSSALTQARMHAEWTCRTLPSRGVLGLPHLPTRPAPGASRPAICYPAPTPPAGCVLRAHLRPRLVIAQFMWCSCGCVRTRQEEKGRGTSGTHHQHPALPVHARGARLRQSCAQGTERGSEMGPAVEKSPGEQRPELLLALVSRAWRLARGPRFPALPPLPRRAACLGREARAGRRCLAAPQVRLRVRQLQHVLRRLSRSSRTNPRPQPQPQPTPLASRRTQLPQPAPGPHQGSPSTQGCPVPTFWPRSGCWALAWPLTASEKKLNAVCGAAGWRRSAERRGRGGNPGRAAGVRGTTFERLGGTRAVAPRVRWLAAGGANK